jgi:hypothetical protein
VTQPPEGCVECVQNWAAGGWTPKSRTKLSFLEQGVLTAVPIAVFVLPSDFGMGEWRWLWWIDRPMADGSRWFQRETK